MRPWSRRLAAALLALSAAWWPATAQEPAGPPAAAEAMDVVLVNVEVWVHDKKGIPIHGLTAKDFEVREDGVPMAITHFAEVRGLPPSVAPFPSEAPRQPGAPLAPAAVEEPGYLVVYFDQLHLTPASARRSAADIKDFLASSPVLAERVLIVRQTFDLFAEAAFGSTREQLEAALSRVAARQTLGDLDALRALTRLQSDWERARIGPTLAVSSSSTPGPRSPPTSPSWSAAPPSPWRACGGRLVCSPECQAPRRSCSSASPWRRARGRTSCASPRTPVRASRS